MDPERSTRKNAEQPALWRCRRTEAGRLGAIFVGRSLRFPSKRRFNPSEGFVPFGFFSVCVHEAPLSKTHPLARNWRVNPSARWKKSCPHVRFERFVTGHCQEEEASVVDFMTVLRSFPINTGANLPVQRQERTIYFTTTCFVFFFLCGVGFELLAWNRETCCCRVTGTHLGANSKQSL